MVDAYSLAGVDIQAGNQAVKKMSTAVKSTYNDQVLAGVGGFASLFKFPGQLLNRLITTRFSPVLAVLLLFSSFRVSPVNQFWFPERMGSVRNFYWLKPLMNTNQLVRI